jgi:uncharacterized protein (DUF2236 family)
MSGSVFADEAELGQLLVGPESVAWRYGSDSRLYFVMLYPLLLQVAHPTVGAGVRDYSDFELRPWNRLLRTLDYVSLLIYGGEDAVAAGRRLRALHKGFQGVREDGERYYALEPAAYAWVHATLLESYVAGHRHFGRPMRPDQVERFYREYRGLGRLVGVREHDLPPDWDGFRAYFDDVVEGQLVRTASVDRVLRATRHAPRPPVPIPELLWRGVRMPAIRAVRVGGIGMMSQRLRDRLGIDWTRRDELQFRALGAATRSLTPVLPRRLQITGPDQLRMRRRAIAKGPLGPGERGRAGATTGPAGMAEAAGGVDHIAGRVTAG